MAGMVVVNCPSYLPPSLHRYAQLEKEVCGVFDLQKDEEGRGALERLHQFLCVDNDAIPHAIVSLQTAPSKVLALNHCCYRCHYTGKVMLAYDVTSSQSSLLPAICQRHTGQHCDCSGMYSEATQLFNMLDLT